MLVLLLTTVLASATVASAGDPFVCDGAYGSIDALLLNRSQPSGRTFGVQEVVNRPTVLSGNDLDFDYEGGLRGTVGVRRGSRAYELVYAGLHDWDTDAAAIGENDISLPGDFGLASLDFFSADAIGASYGSEWHNVEANMWLDLPFGSGERSTCCDAFDACTGGCDSCDGCCCPPTSGLAMLLGVRTVHQRESLGLVSLADADTGAGSRYGVTTRNALVGAQTGLRGWRQFGERLTVSAEGKAGLFANFNRQSQIARDFDNTLAIRDTRDTDVSTALVADAELLARVKLTNSLNFRCGYVVTFFDNLALAPDQLDFTNLVTSGSSVNDNGSYYQHGFVFGLEANF